MDENNHSCPERPDPVKVDSWLANGECSFCGGLHPERVLQLARAGAVWVAKEYRGLIKPHIMDENGFARPVVASHVPEDADIKANFAAAEAVPAAADPAAPAA